MIFLVHANYVLCLSWVVYILLTIMLGILWGISHIKIFFRWQTLDYNCRLGSARAVNRRYISDCVPQKIRMQASAGFVSASALGMACGPALAGVLQTKFKIWKLTFNQDTLPGWVMAVAWLIYLIWLWITFKEPSHETEENHMPHQSNDGTELILHQCVVFFKYFILSLQDINLHLSANFTAVSKYCVNLRNFLVLEVVGFIFLNITSPIITLVIVILSSK